MAETREPEKWAACFGVGTVQLQGSLRPRSDAPLGQYRIYFLDSAAEDRLISGSLEFEAGSDGEAIELAKSLRQGRPIELWNRARKLGAWG